MKDEKSNGKFFPVVFGIMGLTLLVLAWLIPADTSDRIMAAVIGSAGLFGGIIRMPTRKCTNGNKPERVPVNVEVEEKS